MINLYTFTMGHALPKHQAPDESEDLYIPRYLTKYHWSTTQDSRAEKGLLVDEALAFGAMLCGIQYRNSKLSSLRVRRFTHSSQLGKLKKPVEPL